VRAFPCGPSHDCNGVYNTLSIYNYKNPGGCYIYKRCGLDSLSLSLYYLIKTNKRRLSFYTSRFWPQFAQQYVRVRKCTVIPSSCIGKTPSPPPPQIVCVCVCTEKYVFFPDLVWWRAYFILIINNKTIWMNFCPFTNLKPIFFLFFLRRGNHQRECINSSSAFVCVMSAVFSIN